MEVNAEKLRELPGKTLKVINVGLEIFQESLTAQGVQAVQVDWRPPAGGDERMAKLLDKLL
jgi:FdrA protein